ncbi:helicase C-terminal domain protein [Cordyceps fumosorosea ARSEF 2679]|uniref:ATP-dependent DNA helicase n=1 Tax=Cordyceps fumosorosea (strain ARSEF 2679) TaxID=1081104 RepID=A0A168E152_CORFA|nr:helicase C-terminal domain protein [Cordyceps fumosorosea ARSEF 2679]OAA73256.1 helicase C-terminal domain protein [Cordyceps fumosorosea ARSEF 2679]
MSSDEFDDDIADEDFNTAFDQVSSSSTRLNQSFTSSNGHTSGKRHSANQNVAAELEGLPDDAFSSPEPPPTQFRPNTAQVAPRAGLQRSGSGVYRQTTLFGKPLGDPSSQPQAPNATRVFRADLPREEPSHHELNKEALETWVYPTNLGAIRDYQFTIVKNSLFNNTLVALPTGLGKTFIAATVMLNFYRWTRKGKIVFVAPTKPLVAQQIDACYGIAGIPRSDTTLLTGDVQPVLREEEWEKRRVFFMTPQTLLNDLSHGYADPKSICLIVIDEAHRAVGEYAYAKVAKLIRRFSKSFRVLALTATPGSKIETVQEIIDNLGISHCEIRTEDSIDIRQYVHDRNVEQVVLDPSDEMNLVGELFSEALKPLLDKLSAQNIWYGKTPMSMSAFGLLQSQKEWFATRGKHVNDGVKFMMRAIFSVLTSLAHSIKLLNFHGIKPFYDNLVDFRSEQEGKGQKGSKYKRQLIEHPSFQDMMNKIAGWMKRDGFVGHPKQTALADTILNHFMDRGEGSGTRVIVFSEYRDSAEEIVRMLNMHRPLVKASIFVGQADGKRGEGMKQTQQIQTIEKFRDGHFNVLVATSIGEEGLDIGQVDLIVCYDASGSPIRMLQRMGRTGRKRAGNVVLLLMRGKEEEQFAKSKDNYEKMQTLICEGSRFNFRFDLSTRIVPRNIRPEVDKRHVDIPVENTQDTSLPEPKKRRAAAGKKKAPKKFHMPDGVETGFQTLTDFLKGPAKKTKKAEAKRNAELDDLSAVPDLDGVLLSEEQLRELNRSYRDLPFNQSTFEETDTLSMTAHPELQRRLGPACLIKHGSHTKRLVKMLHVMGTDPDKLVRARRHKDDSAYHEIPVRRFVASDGESEAEDDGDVVVEAQKGRRDSFSSTGSLPELVEVRRAAAKAALEDMAAEADGDDDGPRRKKQKTLKKGGKKNKGREGRTAVNLEEVGDDCDRISDVLDTDGSDSGADLQGFVVSDNAPTSSMRDSQPTSSMPAGQGTPRGDNAKPKPFYEPTTFVATQESEGVPELDSIVDSIGKDKPTESDMGVRRAGRRRPRVVEDSDSEMDLL